MPALALLIAGCGTPSSDRPAPPPSAAADPAAPSVAGIAAEVVRLRTDEAVGGRVQVRITATGGEPFTVRGVALESAGFAPLPASEVTASFTPGRVIDLPTPYGAPRCAAAPEPAAALVDLIRDGGAPERVRVPLAGEVLGRIHAEECAVRAVSEVVDIAVRQLREDGDAVTGRLVLTRVGGKDAVTAVALGRSVLVDTTARLPLELGAGERSASTPLSFSPATCEPHVLAETKKPYVFPLTVRVGKEKPASVRLPLDEAARALLAAMVDRVCTGSG